MIAGVELVECKLTCEEEQVRRTLKPQEAKVIVLMRERPYQTIRIVMENGKVVHKERTESFKD